MSKPSQPSPAQVCDLLHAIDPNLRLVTSRPLTGGVSAQVTAIEAQLPGGQVDRLVLRQYGPANLRSDPHVAVHEFALLTLLHAAGLLVPRPRYADESAAIVPVPCLVIEFIDGHVVTEASQLAAPLTDFTGQLAAALAQLHAAEFTLADAPYLADVRAKAALKVETWPSAPDEALRESAVRAAIARIWPPPLLNQPVVLHGDFWPGNTLWRGGTLAAVVDWEDAMFGDPLHDVANARMELCMAFGMSAASVFTRQYRELRPTVDMTALRHWDLYAALRHAGRMADWGVSPADLARLQSGHREFAAALATTIGPVTEPTRPRPAISQQPPLPPWRVLDMSQAISGPYAARILSDLGADVLRIEGPRTDVTDLFGVVTDGRAGMYAQMNAGKRNVGIDLAVAGAADLIRDLAAHADVLIENFRPGVMDRLGLGYHRLSAANPQLIMLSVSGFGATGADAGRRALAPVIHAESGLLARQAELDDREPADLPLALADTMTGLHAAIAVLAALHQRAVTGLGQRIGLSMLAAVAASDDHAHAAIDGSAEPYSSRGTIWQAPGGPILIAAPPKHAWVMLSRRGLIADPAPPGSDLATKARLRQQAIRDWMLGFADRQALIAELEGAGVAWAELRESADVFADQAHSTQIPGTSRRVAAMPYEFSAAAATVRRGVAARGEDNSNALADWLGLDETAISKLSASGVLI